MRGRLTLAIVVLLGLAMPAQAVTIRDLIDLTKAGLGEEVLLALVEVDGGVFPVDAATLRSLKEAGVPERVIAAVVRSGRTPPAPVDSTLTPSAGFDLPADAPPVYDPSRLYGYGPDGYGPVQMPPEVIYVESAPRTVVQEVPVPFYVPVPVAGTAHHRHTADPSRPASPSIGASGLPAPPSGNRTDRPAASSTVYWGNGGRLRPDAWQPAGSAGQWGNRPEPRRAGHDTSKDDGDSGAHGQRKPGTDRRE